ncbi:hypothetical protein GCM10028799_17620 [Kribbella italica]
MGDGSVADRGDERGGGASALPVGADGGGASAAGISMQPRLGRAAAGDHCVSDGAW